MSETIVALSSARGRAGVAVIRVSGPQAWHGLQAMIGTRRLPAPRVAGLYKLHHPTHHTWLDDALVIGMRAPLSYTGEDTIEYHTHGGTAVVDAVLSALLSLPHHRLAEPGEFTRRAFENAKLDLTAAEAVGDLIDAETEAQRVQALDQMGGALARLYEGWADKLKRALAYTEADLDFVDEHDVPDGLHETVIPVLESLQTEIDAHLNDGRRGERLRDGIKIAVVGAPNTGKSTLVNALAQRDVAIVSPHAGTTRDVLEVHLNLGGFPVILADTAGLRPEDLAADAHGSIEGEGIKRALAWAQDADIVVVAFDGADWPQQNPHALALITGKALPIITKAEKITDRSALPYLAISVAQGIAIDAFLNALTDMVRDRFATRCNTPALTRTRHREALVACRANLSAALAAPAIELSAEDMRMALRALGTITGRVHVEDLLDVIFRDFCIGK